MQLFLFDVIEFLFDVGELIFWFKCFLDGLIVQEPGSFSRQLFFQEFVLFLRDEDLISDRVPSIILFLQLFLLSSHRNHSCLNLFAVFR